MPNPVLVRLMDERQRHVEFIDNLLAQVEEAGRDLVDAETANLATARERIAQIDAQRAPLEEFEQLREVSADSMRLVMAGATRGTGAPGGDNPGAEPPAGTRSAGFRSQPRPQYATAGEFVVDYIRAVGYSGAPGGAVPPSEDARSRVTAAVGRDVVGQARAVANNTTPDIVGLLPEPIIGPILTDIDASRPFVASIGVRPLTQPGKTFTRPVITQHTKVDKQGAEKTELASQNLKVGEIPFAKETFGGVVDVSRQVIDWSSPSAWDAILTDLQNIYGADTEDAASAAFAAAVLATVPVADGSIDALIDALYAAAAAIIVDPTMGGRASALRLPDTIWTSVDQWAAIGAALDKARLALLQSPGASSPTSVAGDLLNIPRIMCPGFPAGTIIIGRKNRTEFYEERVGLLTAIEPRLFGIEVAYGGYAAYGTLDATSFAKVVPAEEAPEEEQAAAPAAKSKS